MYHNVYARGPVPASHCSDDGATNVCTAILHMLTVDFGGNASEFEVDACDPNDPNAEREEGDAPWEVEVRFVSSEDARSLRDGLDSFQQSGLDEYGEWDFAFTLVDVD